MSKINKYEDIVKNHYTNTYQEDDRFKVNSHKIEYLTIMRYIKKYLKKGARVLEIGAATGAYSIELAKMGYDVTAVDLTPANVELMKEKSKRIKNITCLVGDALDLKLEDNSFDLVLNLGPMYHLYNKKDKNKAIDETLRVCKKDGICFFAYLTNSSVVWQYGVRRNSMAHLSTFMDKKGRIKDTPEEIFTTYFIEDFKKQFDNKDSTYIKSVSADCIFQIMRDYINDVMSEEDYQKLVDWHFATCEREDQQGLSSHMLYICKKN